MMTMSKGSLTAGQAARYYQEKYVSVHRVNSI
jgi:hypothetical protein